MTADASKLVEMMRKRAKKNGDWLLLEAADALEAARVDGSQ